MIIKNTKLKGVKLILQDDTFEDHRGSYRALYNHALYQSLLKIPDFVEDDVSMSDSKGTLKGIHGDKGTWKLISCLAGKFYLVVVNCDSNNEQFGEWESFTLSSSNRVQILVPPKFGNGHQTLVDNTIFHYKQTSYYGDHKQFTVAWNGILNIPWPIAHPILSERDAKGPFFNFES